MSEVSVKFGELAWKTHGRDWLFRKSTTRGIAVTPRFNRDGVLVGMRPRLRDWREWIVYATGKGAAWASSLVNGTFSHSAAVTFPGTVYFRLWRTALSAASDGSSSGEVTTTPGATGYAAYAAFTATANTTNFSTSAAGSSITNNVNITFGTDASGTPTVVSAGIFSVSGAGGVLYYWADVTSVTLAAGESPQINVSGMTLQET